MYVDNGRKPGTFDASFQLFQLCKFHVPLRTGQRATKNDPNAEQDS